MPKRSRTTGPQIFEALPRIRYWPNLNPTRRHSTARLRSMHAGRPLHRTVCVALPHLQHQFTNVHVVFLLSGIVPPSFPITVMLARIRDVQEWRRHPGTHWVNMTGTHWPTMAGTDWVTLAGTVSHGC